MEKKIVSPSSEKKVPPKPFIVDAVASSEDLTYGSANRGMLLEWNDAVITNNNKKNNNDTSTPA